MDAPGWNLFFASFIRFFFKVPVFYFAPPHVSVWGRSKALSVLKKVQGLICNFSLDFQIYRSCNIFNIPIVLGQHPLVLSLTSIRKASKAGSVLGGEEYRIGLFPGSRKQEVETLFPVFLEVARGLHEKYCVSFLVSVAHPFLLPGLQRLLLEYSELNVCFVDQADYQAYTACDVVLACSGTLTLELALLGIPFLVGYRIDWLSFLWARFYLRIVFVSWPNILLGKRVVQEFIQKQLQPVLVFAEVEKILLNRAYRETMGHHFESLRQQLSQGAPCEVWIQEVLRWFMIRPK